MTITIAQHPNQDVDKQPHQFYGLSSDTKPTIALPTAGLPSPTNGSEFWEYDTGKIFKTYDGTNWVFIRGAGSYLVTKTSSSPLTTGTIFTLAGSVQILSIIGRVTTVIQGQATTVKLGIQADALTIEDMCATLDINAFLVGTLLGITGTYADAMIGTTGKPTKPPTTPINFTCITSGILKVTYGAASTGAIVWEILWIPLNAAGSIVAA